MLCFRYKKLLVPYAENSLDEAARARVERHLAGCASCRAELDCVKSVSDALRTSEVAAAEPSPDTWSRVREKIQAQPAPFPSRFALPRAAYAFAGVLLVAVTGWGVYRVLPVTESSLPAVRQSARAPLDEAAPAVPGAKQQIARVSESPRGPAATVQPGPKPQRGRAAGSLPSDPMVVAKAPEALDGDLSTIVGRPYLPSAAPSAGEAADVKPDAPAGGRERVYKAAGSAPESSAGARADTQRQGEAVDYVALANTQMAQGQKLEAGQSFNQAYLTSDPTTWSSITESVEKAGALKVVASQASTDFSSNNDKGTGLVLYTLQMRQKDTSGMVNTARRLVSLHPDDPNLWFKLGEAYEAAGNRAAAIEAYQKAASFSDKEISAQATSRVQKLKSAASEHRRG